MRIRAGYQISYDCPQPTPMILQLSVHPSRIPDLLSWDRLQFDPAIPANRGPAEHVHGLPGAG